MPLTWLELVGCLIGIQNPPTEVRRTSKNSFVMEFKTQEQAQAVGGKSWHVEEYVLMSRYLGSKKAKRNEELEEVASQWRWVLFAD